MKTISIISIVAIIVISATSVGVFIGKINDNPQQPYLAIEINGITQNYTVNEPISFSVILQGYGTACGDTKATITKENDSKFLPLVWTNQSQCVANQQFSNFKFTAFSDTTKIDQAGNYTLTVIFDDLNKHQKTMMEKFTVIKPVLPDDLSVTQSTHVDLNYSVTGNGKILDTNMTSDINTATIVSSLDSPSSGVLTVSLPKLLGDRLDEGAQMTVLLDGQETAYFDQIKNKNYDIVFQFSKGTRQVIIAAVTIK